MKEILNLLTILIISLIKNCKSLEKIKFIITEIENSNSNCVSGEGIYFFYINGNFSSEFDRKNVISIKFENPPTNVLCIAYSKNGYSRDRIKCEINICEFPLEEDVILSPEEPIDDNFEFPNWNSFMTENPGVSNRIVDSDCFPNPKGYFTPNNIEPIGCEGNNITFIINGKWNDENIVTFGKDTFRLPLLSQEGKKAECQFINITNFKCSYNGYGEINFDTFYFKAILSAYKVFSLDQSINMTECKNASFNKSYKIPKINIILNAFLICFILI